MTPQLTETWGTAYLQIVIVLIVFAFGIPALIFQFTVPEEVRRVIHRHMKVPIYIVFIIVFILTIFAVCFIWVLHPCSDYLVPHTKHIAGGAHITIAILMTVLFWWIYLGRFSRERIILTLKGKLLKVFLKKGYLKQEVLTDILYLGEMSEPGYEKDQVLFVVVPQE